MKSAVRPPISALKLIWPSGSRRLAFISSPNRTASERIYVVDAAGGAPENLLADWQYEPNQLAWLPDGRISFSADIGGRTALFLLDPATKKSTEVLSGRAGCRDSTGITTAKSSPTSRPASPSRQSSSLPADGKGERQLTRFNDKLAPKSRSATPSASPTSRWAIWRSKAG